MLLIEIMPETNIIFELDFKGQKYEFASVVIDKEKDAIFTQSIKINGKVLGFGSSGVTVSLIMNRDGKPPIVWKGIGVTSVPSKIGTIYKVVANGNGFEMNRREAFRLFVGIQGVVQIGVNRRATDIIVKDVSETGFSFVSSEDMDDVLNKPVRMVFADLKQNYSLIGLVVRKVVIAENKILYGCKISVPNNNLERYINEKQRQMLVMNRNNAASINREQIKQSLTELSKSQTEELNKSSKGNQNSKRNINTVEKVERREVFKDVHFGKRV